MGLVIDSCIFIGIERKKTAMDFSKLTELGEAYISSITVSELLTGVHMAKDEIIKLKRLTFVEYIISGITAIPFDNKVARVHSEIYAYLLKKHYKIAAHDLIIAATALTYDCKLLTENVKDFVNIPSLKILTLDDIN